MSVSPLPASVIIILIGVVQGLGGVALLAAVGNFSSIYTFLGVFLLGGVAATLPFAWAYAQYVPLVLRDA